MYSSSRSPARKPAGTAHRTGRTSPRGFTLIEILVTLSILAIILALAVPSFDSLIARNRVQTASKHLVGLLQYAQSQALISERLVMVSPLDAGWESPLQVSRSNALPATDFFRPSSFGVLRKLRIDDSDKVTIGVKPSIASLIFDGHGVVDNPEIDFPVVFSLASGSYATSICLARSGAVEECE